MHKFNIYSSRNTARKLQRAMTSIYIKKSSKHMSVNFSRARIRTRHLESMEVVYSFPQTIYTLITFFYTLYSISFTVYIYIYIIFYIIIYNNKKIKKFKFNKLKYID